MCMCVSKENKQVLDLVLRKGITSYDASYMWLAKSQKIKLLTLDERLENVTK